MCTVFSPFRALQLIELMLDGNSEQVSHAQRKIGLFREEEKNPICDCSLYHQMPCTDQITGIAPYMRNYL